MDLWHDIEPGTDESINVIIETPRGSNNKYEIDKDTGIIKLDRANYNSAPYPFDYGFVPRTYWHDGDALDVVLLSTYPVPPGILVRVRPVALMEMIDTGDNDYKIIGVPTKDKRWDDVQDVGDINQHTIKEIQHFFETYKQLKGDEVTVNGFKGKKEAVDAFSESIKLYNEKFKK